MSRLASSADAPASASKRGSPASFALAAGAIAAVLSSAFPTPSPARAAGGAACPPEMVRVRGFCIDRYEASAVDQRSGETLSPYYPPEPRLVESVYQAWLVEKTLVGDALAQEQPLPELPLVQRTRSDYVARAVSRAGSVPQGYLSQPLARRLCERAGKRLCTESEWVTACKGDRNQKFPYGEHYEQGRCNVYRSVHPATALHGSASYGHRDPRLNLVTLAAEGPLLRLTGSTAGCASHWGSERIFDMVGNLDEWVEDEVFLGGFYARSTREGCESKVSSHAAAYYDYSTGTRCCRDLEPR